MDSTSSDKIQDQLAELRTMILDLRGQIQESDRRIRRNDRLLHASTYKSFESLLATRSLADGIPPLPPFSTPVEGWTISANLSRILAESIIEKSPSCVLEIGSGSSSILIGLLLKSLRRSGELGRLISLEHDPAWYSETLRMIAQWGLEDVVEIRYAPLAKLEIDGSHYLWYDRESIEDITGIDLLFVDGPPGDTCEMARFPAGPLLIPRCSEGATIFLDDTSRDEEKEIVERWVDSGDVVVLSRYRWGASGATVMCVESAEGSSD